MAEGLLQHKNDQQNLGLEIDSAGTSNYHVGEAPDKRMQAKAAEYGIDISNQRGRQFTAADFDAFDYIFPMDTSNYTNVMRLARNEDDRNKVKLFLDYIAPGEEMSVPDPYYGGDEGFEEVFQLLNKATDVFIESLNEWAHEVNYT